MKIAAILDNKITAGGGFSQALNAILQMIRLCEGHHDFFVYTSVAENVPYLAKLNVTAKYYRLNWVDAWLIYSSTRQLPGLMQKKLRLIGGLEKQLLADDIDLVYFLTPTIRCLSLQKLNYIATVWDLCHRDTPEFPEVRQFGQFAEREYLYASTLAQALLVICDSGVLAERIAYRYGIELQRLLVMPFAPGPLTGKQYSLEKGIVLQKYGLSEGYYFYPAQFWSHKNHARILEALHLLQQQGYVPHVVFCGGDHGNLSHVKVLTASLRLEQQVHFLGFVPEEDLRGLYEGARAVVMPTYFGPTNLPPLEAWAIGRPLIYSSYCREQAGSAALLADPDSATEWCDAMLKITDDEVAARLVVEGEARLREIDTARQQAESLLASHLATFSARLRCWK